MAKKKKNQISDEEDAAQFANIDEDGEDLGGLMATLKTMKSKKSKKNKKRAEEDEEDAAEFLANLDEPKFGFAALQDDGDVNDSVENIEDTDDAKDEVKSTKTKKEKAVKEPAEIPEDGEIRIKSKKEKEREKKERQKLEKKKAAEKNGKKATVRAETPPAESQSPAEPEAEVVEEEAPAKGGKNDKKGKKKGPGAAIAAIREAQLLRQRLEAEQAAAIKAEEDRIQAEEDALEAEREAIEARKREKKEREKEKIAQLKKEGKYMTPAQKAAAALAKIKLEAMLNSGNVMVEALAEGFPYLL
jgi:translation initiation factor 5B